MMPSAEITTQICRHYTHVCVALEHVCLHGDKPYDGIWQCSPQCKVLLGCKDEQEVVPTAQYIVRYM